MKKPIIVLAGPTASGKTALSFKLAKKFNGEIICADSMTIYKGMDIGTDKPTLGKSYKVKKLQSGVYEIEGTRHHLLDILEPNQEFNVAVFQKLAEAAVKDIQKRDKVPFLVGGSNLFIDSFVYNYSFPSVEPNRAFRKLLEKKSNEKLFEEICKLDPDCEWTLDRNNRRRLIRAYEVLSQSRESLRSLKTREPLPKNVLYLAIKKGREELYSKINERVERMMDEGFVDEVRGLHKKYDHNTAMQAAGYKQLCAFLDGEVSLDAAVEKTKQVHRNYAKRQLTWLRRNPDIVWVGSQGEAQDLISHFLLACGK